MMHMEIISNIFWGLLFIGLGVAVLKYFQVITENIGRFETLERFFTGATFALWMLIGFGLVILGVLTVFGLVDNLLRFFFSPLKGIF